jgi:Zn-dependent M28 family amino/carboxypeptidase
MAIMDREDALRALRLLRIGKTLNTTLRINNSIDKPYKTNNVIGEIPGTEKPEEFVIIGAHLDSWDLGNGALDNGCNVAMVLDIARQMKRLGLRPERTIRFILWNGEEQGLFGSYAYTNKHKNQLEKHIMASSYDIGSGRITGFFTGGRTELLNTLDSALHHIPELGHFNNIDAPVVGTDNYDFMMQGVPNLVAMQESANYGPNYHAASDTYDKVDLEQVRKNSVVAAVVTYYFATAPLTLKRQSRTEIEQIMKSSDLEEQMKSMYGLWQGWVNGTRGRTE